jgi:hypothetical protein
MPRQQTPRSPQTLQVMAEGPALRAQGWTYARIGERYGIRRVEQVQTILRRARYEAHLRDGTILDGCLCPQCWPYNGPAWLEITLHL